MREQLLVTVAIALAACSSPMPNGDGGDASVPDGGDSCAASVDEPDVDGLDSNCDGIDGDVSRAVFVATTGDDSAPGTMSRPVRSLGVALDLAARDGRTQVLVANGTYTEATTVALLEGTEIFGGYDATNGWHRGSEVPVVHVPAYGLDAVDIAARTEIARVRFECADASEPGASSIALRAVRSSGLVVRDHAALVAGHGANGAAGTNGARGNDGPPGAAGIAGAVDNEFEAGGGGLGGKNMACRDEASGGDGGSGGRHYTNFTGDRGRDSTAGAMGGAGGSMASCTGRNGSGGSDGSAGTFGANGAGAGAVTTLDAMWFTYVPSNGTRGDSGTAGGGGGGGGGSSGQTGSFCTDGGGNGGGGGGAGGCGGEGGGGGAGGGASIAVALWSSPITIENATIATRGGGEGGRGGGGGTGGAGGSGGAGASTGASEVGSGGSGGRGAMGGGGGAGGGGGGGPSVGIWSDGTRASTNAVTFDVQPGGAGGVSLGGGASNGRGGATWETL